MESSDDDSIPEEIMEAANQTSGQLIPEKSKRRYEKELQIFEDWCRIKKVSSLKEEVFLAYFNHLSKTYSPSTLWSKYSMLKLNLKIKKNLDLSHYFKLTAYLKKANKGFMPKKSKILEKAETDKFLSEAPDLVYLMIKVATIFGIAGACRRDELTRLTVDDIEEKEDILLITIPNTKTNFPRKFVVCDPDGNSKYMELYRKYKNLRPADTHHRRFFVAYNAGKCSKQCIGINSFGKMPSNIAGYLHLPNPELYTGHCFRRSSATMLANAGSNITNIKRHGGRKSTSVAESYIEDSIENKKKIALNILENSSMPVTSRFATTSPLKNQVVETQETTTSAYFPMVNRTQRATTVRCSENE